MNLASSVLLANSGFRGKAFTDFFFCTDISYFNQVMDTRNNFYQAGKPRSINDG